MCLAGSSRRRKTPARVRFLREFIEANPGRCPFEVRRRSTHEMCPQAPWGCEMILPKLPRSCHNWSNIPWDISCYCCMCLEPREHCSRCRDPAQPCSCLRFDSPRFEFGLPLEDRWSAECEITRVLDAKPGEPEKLDFIEGSVGNAKAYSTLCCTRKAGSRECRV